MNKKLMAAAVAAAFVTPALVYAQNATVQVYGKAFMEYGYADQGDGRPKTDIVQTPGSAVGFKGQEQLGGGLSAWFQCETSADIRGLNQDGWCSRNSAIGLKGGFGNIYMGKWDTPMKRSYVGQVGVADTGLGGFAFILAGNSTGTGVIGGQGASQSIGRNVFKRRESGLVTYESPNFGGFQVLAAYSIANATSVVNATTNEKPRIGSLAGMYSNGPLNVALAYEKHWDVGTGGAGVGGGTGQDDRGWTLGASYNFMGNLLLGAQFTDMRFETSTGTAKKQTWFLGGDWNFAGPHHVTGGFGYARDGKGSGANIGGANAPIVIGSDTGAKLYNIAYQFDLSKRTNTRLGFVYLDNDSSAVYTLGGLAAANTVGDSQSAIYMSFDHRW
jgi:predicted porin